MGSAASFIRPSASAQVPVLADSFPRLGVSVRFLQDFIIRCGGHARVEPLTCQQVCEKFILPTTTRKQESYVEWMLGRCEADVGFAQVFVIHSWAASFLSLVDALEHHFRHQPNILIWVDLFSINQHRSVIYDEYWWRKLCRFGIEQIGHAVVVMPSLYEQNVQHVLSRAWCLYEMYVSLDTETKLDVAYRKRDQLQMLREIVQCGGRQLLDRSFPHDAIDVQRSHCTKPTDKSGLINALNQTIDFQAFNGLINHCLRLKLIQYLQQGLSQRVLPMTKSEEAAVLYRIAKMYQAEDYVKEAEHVFQQCLEIRKLHIGALHKDTFQVMNALAALYGHTGDFAKAEELYQYVLQQQNVLHGEYNRNTLIAMNNIAILYGHQDHLHDAKTLFEVCLQKSMQYLSSDDPLLFSLGLNLACIYERLCLYEQAESMYMFCLEKQKAVQLSLQLKSNATRPEPHDFGDDDWKYPLTHVGFYRTEDQLQHAEKLYIQSLQQCVGQFGEHHPYVAICLTNLAHLYESEGKYFEAMYVYNQCLFVRRIALGDTHIFTSITMSDLACLYLKQEQFQEAHALFEECYQQRKQSLGATHPYTLLAYEYIRNCQRDKRKHGGESHKASLMTTATTVSTSSST